LVLTQAAYGSRLGNMEVHFSNEQQSKLDEAAEKAGCQTDHLVQDVMAAYLDELTQVRDTLDSRHDDIKE
jgi:hypothetical protein